MKRKKGYYVKRQNCDKQIWIKFKTKYSHPFNVNLKICHSCILYKNLLKNFVFIKKKIT